MADKDQEAYLDELLRSMDTSTTMPSASIEPTTDETVNDETAIAEETPIELNEEIINQEPVLDEQAPDFDMSVLDEQASDFDMSVLNQMISGEIMPEELLEESFEMLHSEDVLTDETEQDEDILTDETEQDEDALSGEAEQDGDVVTDEVNQKDDVIDTSLDSDLLIDNLPIEETVVEDTPGSDDPNKMMSADDIAALFAQMNGEDSNPVDEILGEESNPVDETNGEELNLVDEVDPEALLSGSLDSDLPDIALDNDGTIEDVSLEELMKDINADVSEDEEGETNTDESGDLSFDDSLSLDDVSLDDNASLENEIPLAIDETSEVEEQDNDLSIDDMIKAVQGEMEDSSDDLFSSFDGITTEANATDVPDPLAGSDNYGESDDLDIFALDDGASLGNDSLEPEIGGLSEEERAAVEAMEEENSDDAPTMDIEDEEGSKKKKKKFSLKNFFLKFSDDDEEKPVDMNEEMMKELYGDRDSLADANPEEEFSEDKKKKKGKKKKEPKPKKEKQPKPKKEKKPKPPKDPANEVKFSLKGLIILIVIGAVLVAGVVVGGNFLNHKLTYRHAQTYYDQKNYQAAYETLAGLKLTDSEKPLFDKVSMIVNVKQGLDGFNTFFELGNNVEALDALVRAIGRKNEMQELIVSANAVLETDKYYFEILDVLEKFGISEETALDLYAIKHYSEYHEQLEKYGRNYKK